MGTSSWVIQASVPSPGWDENCGDQMNLLAPLSRGWLVYLSSSEASNRIIITFFLWVEASVLLGHKSTERNYLAPSHGVILINWKF